MSSRTETYADFAKLARQYCAVIEDPLVRGKRGMRKIQPRLLAVYTAGATLPAVQAGRSPERMDLSPLWRQLVRMLPERLGVNLYWDVSSPLQNPPEGMMANSLADDLASVWLDLKVGLMALDSPHYTKPETIWWDWRSSFFRHWGAHATGALRAIHYALRDRH